MSKYDWIDNPTQGILDARGIFLYNTPNEPFKILDDKVVLKLDFSGESQISPNPKTVVSADGSNINLDHAILMEKFKALTTNINYEFLKIKEKLKEMQGDHRNDEGNHVLDCYMSDDMPMFDPMEVNYIKGYHRGYHDQNSKISYSYPNHDVLPNHVGDKELKSMDGFGNRVLTKKDIKKDENGMPKEPNKEWKLNKKVVPHNKEVYHYQWHPTGIPHLNRIIKKS
uniref:Reverse transcriptase domain-containing protein n=1 Tax=Tanacetum cinerariifolium TaxID=118510 RepID=A0A6L2J8I1_TANCI|nr:reverse transcriptase domain-containing protein [Tanacetum cinerariifolium]